MSARLTARFVDGRSRITEAESSGPLRLVCPNTDAPSAWAYQSSLGGGFIGADHLSLEVRVDAGATLFLSSQASSKVYGATGARFELDAEVGDGATLVLWPEPTSCFAGAELTQRQHLSLSPRSSLLCVDSFSAGRISRDERWDFAKVTLGLEVDSGGVPVLREALELNPRHGALRERLGSFNTFTTVVLAGPRFSAAAERIHEEVSAAPAPTGPTRWISSRRPGLGVILKGAAESPEALQVDLRRLLATSVSDALGDDPLRGKW